VGSIGLTIGVGDLTLVEINESAVNEMQKNIKKLKEAYYVINRKKST